MTVLKNTVYNLDYVIIYIVYDYIKQDNWYWRLKCEYLYLNALIKNQNTLKNDSYFKLHDIQFTLKDKAKYDKWMYTELKDQIQNSKSFTDMCRYESENDLAMFIGHSVDAIELIINKLERTDEGCNEYRQLLNFLDNDYEINLYDIVIKYDLLAPILQLNCVKSLVRRYSLALYIKYYEPQHFILCEYNDDAIPSLQKLVNERDQFINNFIV